MMGVYDPFWYLRPTPLQAYPPSVVRPPLLQTVSFWTWTEALDFARRLASPSKPRVYRSQVARVEPWRVQFTPWGD